MSNFKEEASGAEFSHLDERGRARMVDDGGKPETERVARARADVIMRPDVAEKIRGRAAEKGDVLQVARIAGIMAAKRTSDLIPLCHPIEITSAAVDFSFVDKGRLQVEAVVRTVGRTGVEMEALTAVSVAALTVYDMCKALQRDMEIGPVRLMEKSGGRSGRWSRQEP